MDKPAPPIPPDVLGRCAARIKECAGPDGRFRGGFDLVCHNGLEVTVEADCTLSYGRDADGFYCRGAVIRLFTVTVFDREGRPVDISPTPCMLLRFLRD